jgi:hypothetical protein
MIAQLDRSEGVAQLLRIGSPIVSLCADERRRLMSTSSHWGNGIIDEESALAHAADVTHWRCRRVNANGRNRGTLLWWGGACEWSIDLLAPDAIPDRWGPGTYVIEYARLGEDGAREKRGRSAPLGFQAPPAPTAETFANPVAYSLYVIRRAERDRAALAANERRAIERESLRLKADLERHRLTHAHALECERLASNERIARIKARSRPVPIEIRLPDWLDPAPKPKSPGPSSKPN